MFRFSCWSLSALSLPCLCPSQIGKPDDQANLMMAFLDVGSHSGAWGW